MSVLISFVQDAIPLAGDSSTLVAAGGGITDWLTNKNQAVATLVRAVAITFVMIFVLYQAYKSGFAAARIIMASITGAILLWVVFNVTDLQDRVDTEINATASLVQSIR